MDVFSKAKRSDVMSKIRGRGNRSTERRMAAMLRARRISGWQMHRSDIPGTPDFYFPELRLALFIDGCFWHQCPRCATLPEQNGVFWTEKLMKNVRRDRRVRRALNRAGIAVWRLWEHDLERNTPRFQAVVAKIAALGGDA
jgi:DNA mismatch endonuclease (patch repair protein)